LWHYYTAAGKQMQNGFVETFDGCMHDELLSDMTPWEYANQSKED
jgi:hypothetical protein